MKSGDIVYYATSDTGTIQSRFNCPIVYPSWGIVDYIAERTNVVKINLYVLDSFPLVDGVSYFDYKPSDKWIKCPNKVKYDSLLKLHLQDRDLSEIQARFKGTTLNDKDKIKELVDEGVYIPKVKTTCLLETEIDHKQYRLRWKAQYPNSVFKTSEYRNIKEVFSTYEEAQVYCKVLKADYYRKKEELLEVEFLESVESIVERVPCTNKEELQLFLMSLPHEYGFGMRYYEDEILYRKDSNEQWKSVWNFNI